AGEQHQQRETDRNADGGDSGRQDLCQARRVRCGCSKGVKKVCLPVARHSAFGLRSEQKAGRACRAKPSNPMAKSVLSRYLDPEVLSHVADRPIEPRGLVIGNLAGAHKSPMAGFAVEFAGHREYVPGDDPKHVDWRVYFTRDKYFVKQYELETNFVCHLILDVSESMRYGEGRQQKLLYAAQMATTLGYSIVRQTDKVSFATFDTQVRGYIPA